MRLRPMVGAIMGVLGVTVMAHGAGAGPRIAAAEAAAPEPGGAQEPPVAPAQGGVVFGSLGYADTAVRGVNASASFFFPLTPGASGVGGSSLDLEISHSPLLVPDLSTVTVDVGAVSLASAFLGSENANHGHITVSVPPELLTGKGLAVEVRFYLRLTRDPCEDPTNPALWATVHQASKIVLATTTTSRDLGDLSGLVTAPATLGQPLQLVVPSHGSPDLLAAAGTTAARLGRLDAGAVRDPVLQVSSTPSPDTSAVFVGTGADVPSDSMLPVDWTGQGYQAEGVAIDPGEGVLAVAQKGPLRVLVGGATPAAVRHAANAFADPARSTLLAGQVARVTGTRAAPPARESTPWVSSAASFAQLGIDRREVIGPGLHVIDLNIERPAGWTTSRTGHLDLVLDATAGLRDTSHFQASVNGYDLGTQRITAAGSPRTYRLDLPGGLVDRRLDGQPVRSLTLRVTLNLEPVEQGCAPVDVKGLGASVLPTSAWYLPHSWYDGFDLGRFPSRLLDSRPSRAIVVLPRGPDDTTVAAGLQLCAALGRWSEPDIPLPSLTTTDRLTGEERRTHNLVLVGSADQELGHPIDAGRTATTAAPGAPVAVMALRASPLNDDRTVLVIHGDGPALVMAAQALSSTRIITSLRGARAALVGRPSQPPSAIPQSLEAASGAGPPAELAPVVSTPAIRVQTVIGAVALTLFLTLVLLVVWFRWLQPRRGR